MLCRKCNASNAPEAIRCAECGASLDVPAGASHRQPGEVAAVAGAAPRSAARTGHYLAFIAIILGLGSVIFTAVMFIIRNQGELLSDDDILLCRIVLYVGLGLGSLLGLVAVVLGYRNLTSGHAAPRGPSGGHDMTGIVLGGIDFVVFLAGVIVVATLFTSYFHTGAPQLKKPAIQAPADDTTTEPK